MITSFWAFFQCACLIVCALVLLWKQRSYWRHLGWFIMVMWWLLVMTLQMVANDLTPTYFLSLLSVVIVFMLCKITLKTQEPWPLHLAVFVAFSMIWEFICAYSILKDSILRLHVGAIPFYLCLIRLPIKNFKGWIDAKYGDFFGVLVGNNGRLGVKRRTGEQLPDYVRNNRFDSFDDISDS